MDFEAKACITFIVTISHSHMSPSVIAPVWQEGTQVR